MTDSAAQARSGSFAPEPAQRLGQRALSLGAANAFDFAVQFLLPVVLARCLDTAAFGEYRLVWLVAGTVLAVATLAMPASLYYYLPRSDAAAKRLYINQTLIFLVGAGLVSAWAVSAWNPWLPEGLRGLTRHHAVLPAFILLWVVASLLDLLPTAEERVTWQAKVTVGLAALRAVALSLAAILTGELGPVLLVLLAFVVFKTVLLLGYVARFHGLRGPALRWRAFAGHLLYAAPLGAAGALYGLRVQADQWLVAALFPLGMFAAFSVAAVLGPVLNLCRQSVNFAFLPIMSRRQAAGDVAGMLELNSRGNIMVGAIVFPLFAFAFVFANEVVTLVYTAAYLDAAPVMRVYIVGIVALVIELSSPTMLLRQAVFVMGVNAVALVLGVAINWVAAVHLGLAGAAMGSTIVIHLDRIATLWRIARITGVPIRRLQDWRTLALLILFAIVAALLAWSTVALYFAASGALVRMLAGGIVLASAYAALAAASGLAGVWLTSVRGQKLGT
ncbi:MAG: oligosaccharide flippase family protein [Burkholderiales bacterium]